VPPSFIVGDKTRVAGVDRSEDTGLSPLGREIWRSLRALSVLFSPLDFDTGGGFTKSDGVALVLGNLKSCMLVGDALSLALLEVSSRPAIDALCSFGFLGMGETRLEVSLLKTSFERGDGLAVDLDVNGAVRKQISPDQWLSCFISNLMEGQHHLALIVEESFEGLQLGHGLAVGATQS
jgi:hypothetical protein